MPAEPLTPAQIEQLRDSLKTRQQQLEQLVNSTHSGTETVTLDQQSVGRVSRIDALQQQQMALANQQQASAQLRAIERALRAIDSGDFGICSECGENIAFARLEVQPFSSLCLGCQSSRENA